MAYATEAELRAAITAYRALHAVFYRFYHAVRHPPGGTPDQQAALRQAISTAEQDYRKMIVELVPALARTYGGPRHYVERLDQTLMKLGVQHASSPQAPFDAELTHEAYIDIDNILETLLCERANHQSAFDDAFTDNDGQPGALIVRPKR